MDVLLYSAAAVRANALGALPYEAAWIEKGPAAMGLFQALFALFGAYNFAALAGAWLALTLTTAALVGSLAEEIGPPGAGGWAAALFVVSIGAIGGTLNSEIPAAAAAAGSLAAWFRSHRSASPSGAILWTGLAGLLAGVAFLCRQNAGALLPILLVAEAWRALRGASCFRIAAARAAAFAGSFVALAAGTVAIYAARGSLGSFAFCFYTYNRDIYVAATRVDAARLLRSPLVAAENFLLPIRTAAVAGFAGIVLAIAGFRRGASGRGPAREPALVVVAVAAGLTASLFVGLRLFTHYFALVLPFWTALGGAGVATLAGAGGAGPLVADSSREPGFSRRAVRRLTARRIAVAGVLAISLLVELRGRGIVSSARMFVRLARTGWAAFSDPVRWPGADANCAEAAAFIRRNSTPEDRVFVWGMRPHVLAYAGRVQATRFTTSTFLAGLVPWERSAPEEDTTRWIVPGSWDLLASDLAAEKPRFIVDASMDHLFGMGAYAPDRFPVLAGFLNRGYERAFETGEGDRLVVWRRKTPP